MINEILRDTFERISEVVHRTVKDLTEEELTYRPDDSANSIVWLVWHLTRIQDDHIASVAKQTQVWNLGWYEKFDLPFDESDTGYGHSSEDVGEVRVSAKNLLLYFDEVNEATKKYLETLEESDYETIVDDRWDPPVTLSIRLVSVISDDLQHAGQAAYIKGLLKQP
jgi:hypothetical protein